MRDLRVYLEDIVESCEKIVLFLDSVKFEAFSGNPMLFDAVVRNLEVIGEAAKKVPEATRALEPRIEWKKISGLRDILAHEYFGLEPETLWDIARNQVPRLLERTRALLERLPPD